MKLGGSTRLEMRVGTNPSASVIPLLPSTLPPNKPRKLSYWRITITTLNKYIRVLVAAPNPCATPKGFVLLACELACPPKPKPPNPNPKAKVSIYSYLPQNKVDSAVLTGDTGPNSPVVRVLDSLATRGLKKKKTWKLQFTTHIHNKQYHTEVQGTVNSFQLRSGPRGRAQRACLSPIPVPLLAKIPTCIPIKAWRAGKILVPPPSKEVWICHCNWIVTSIRYTMTDPGDKCWSNGFFGILHSRLFNLQYGCCLYDQWFDHGHIRVPLCNSNHSMAQVTPV